jgi:hypothetical protein
VFAVLACGDPNVAASVYAAPRCLVRMIARGF